MIIIGYHGVGKSSISKGYDRRIDLDPSSFWYNGKCHEDWYIYYSQMALELSKQGYTVFVSSHYDVRKFLSENNDSEVIYVIYPDKSLKDEWIGRLRRRYYDTNLQKDYKAWQNAEDRFNENITEIEERMNNFKYRAIIDMNYNLDTLVTSIEHSLQINKKRIY